MKSRWSAFRKHRDPATAPRRHLATLCLVLLAAFPKMLLASALPVTFYGGLATDKFFTQVFRNFDFAPNGFMFGVAADPRLATLGAGFSLESEAQFTQYTFGHNYQSFALGIGLRYDGRAFGHSLSIAAYTGPSYATDPPKIGIGPGDKPVHFAQKRWLNYVSVEIAVGPSHASPWQGVFRMYHRSGAFGLYSKYADEGSVLGLGVRYRFGER